MLSPTFYTELWFAYLLVGIIIYLLLFSSQDNTIIIMLIAFYLVVTFVLPPTQTQPNSLNTSTQYLTPELKNNNVFLKIGESIWPSNPYLGVIGLFSLIAYLLYTNKGGSQLPRRR